MKQQPNKEQALAFSPCRHAAVVVRRETLQLDFAATREMITDGGR
jgi:hypothetical protein